MIATKWKPVQVLKHAWMAGYPCDGGVSLDGSRCWGDEAGCRAVCDERNARILGEANTDIDRLEGELAAARSRKAVVEAPI